MRNNLPFIRVQRYEKDKNLKKYFAVSLKKTTFAVLQTEI